MVVEGVAEKAPRQAGRYARAKRWWSPRSTTATVNRRADALGRPAVRDPRRPATRSRADYKDRPVLKNQEGQVTW